MLWNSFTTFLLTIPCRIPILITVLMVVLSTVSPLSSHTGIIDLSFLFGKVQVSQYTYKDNYYYTTIRSLS